MSCEPQERKRVGPYLRCLRNLVLDVAAVQGIARLNNVAVPIVECQTWKYWVHGIKDARRDKLCRPYPEFWRNDWNHGGNPEL